MVKLSRVIAYTNDYLNVSQFEDYCPNGLQVQGKTEVRKIVSGVTASERLIDAAIANQADMLLVHHGYFWRGEPSPMVGIKRKRIAKLLAHDINLFAYHLPLDRHSMVGNNAQLAALMGWQIEARWKSMQSLPLVCTAKLESEVSGDQLAAQLENRLARKPQYIEVDRPIRRVAWCTGAAQNYLSTAVELGADAFVSGEISEQTVHEARENNIHYFAAGHHATERYGVMALGSHLAEHFSVEHEFIDCDNPV